MSVDNINNPLSVAMLPNNEVLHQYFTLDPAKIYSTGAVSASTDPFSSKTNKFAESRIIEVTSTAAFHIKFGTSAITAVTTSDWLIATQFRPAYFVIDKDRPHVRVIPNSGTQTIFVREIF